MRWPPVIFTIGTLVLVGDVGDAAQLRRRRHAAVDARDDAERAVLLDVGVDAVVDEPRVALVVVLAAPERLQQRREAGLALRVLVAAGQRGEHRRDAAQAALADRARRAPACAAARPARSSAPPGRPPRVAGARLEHLLHLRLARAAAGAGARRVAERLQAAAPACDRRRQRALGHAVAVADLRVVGQRRRRDRRARRASSGKSSSARLSGSAVPPVEGLQQRRRAVGIAEQDRAAPAGRRGRSASCRCRAPARCSAPPRRRRAGSLSPITRGRRPSP